MGLASVQIELAQTSLSAQQASGKTALYASARTLDGTDGATVDGVDGHLVHAVGLEDGLLVGDVVLVVLAGKLQPERARTRASHIIAINVHVVDTDSGIRVIYPIKYERNANQPKTSEYSPSWHHYPSGGTDRKTGTPGTQDSGQDPWSPEHSKHYPLQPW